MRLAFVSPRLHEPGTVGGAETLLHSLAVDASRLGHEVEFLVTCAKNHFTWANELPEEAFDWYLDLRKYGSVPHAGFGMGIERAVAWICGLEHVRETIPFPRMLHKMYP